MGTPFYSTSWRRHGYWWDEEARLVKKCWAWLVFPQFSHGFTMASQSGFFGSVPSHLPCFGSCHGPRVLLATEGHGLQPHTHTRTQKNYAFDVIVPSAEVTSVYKESQSSAKGVQPPKVNVKESKFQRTPWLPCSSRVGNIAPAQYAQRHLLIQKHTEFSFLNSKRAKSIF